MLCISGLVVRVALEVDGAIRARGETFDETFKLAGRDFTCDDAGLVGDSDVVEGSPDCVRSDGDEDGVAGSTLDGAAAVVEEKLAAEGRA